MRKVGIALGSVFLVLSLIQIFQGIPAGSFHWDFLLEFRLSRWMAALALGVILSVAGVCLQTLFANPLAEPYTLGVASSSALGSVVALSIFGNTVLAMMSGTILGAAVVILLLWSVLNKNSVSASVALLTGVMISHLSSALLTVWISLARPEGIHAVLTWLMGDCTRATPKQSFLLLLVALLFFGWSVLRSQKLDAFLFGEDEVESFGVNKDRIRNESIVVVSIAIGVSVALAGVIGFVGLMVPHFARQYVGSRHKKLLVLSTVLGVLVLLFADLASRLVGSISTEIPVGAITSLVGAPTSMTIAPSITISPVTTFGLPAAEMMIAYSLGFRFGSSLRPAFSTVWPCARRR